MKKNFDVYMIDNDENGEAHDVSVLINYLVIEILNKKLRFSKEDITRRAEQIANEIEVGVIPENVFICICNRLQWFTV